MFPADHPQKLFAHRARHPGLSFHEISGLPWIVGKVIELGPRSENELLRAAAKTLERAEAVLKARNVGLGVGGRWHSRGAAFDRGAKASSLRGLHRREAEKVEEGRRDIDDAREIVNARTPGRARISQKQWNSERRLVEEVAVSELSVLTQRLPVVRGEHDDGLVGEVTRIEPVEEVSHERVHESHLSAVAALVVASRRVTLGREVGGVRIVKMHEGEKRLVSQSSLQPVERPAENDVSPALRHEPAPAGGFVRGLAQIVIIERESLVETEPPVENERAHEGGSVIVLRPQVARERLGVLGQVESDIIVDTMSEGARSGKERSVCGKRRRRRAGDVVERHSGLRDSIHSRRSEHPGSVTG